MAEIVSSKYEEVLVNNVVLDISEFGFAVSIDPFDVPVGLLFLLTVPEVNEMPHEMLLVMIDILVQVWVAITN